VGFDWLSFSSVMAAETTHDDERPPLRRTWPQRLLIAGVACTAAGSLLAAGLVWFTQQQLEDRQLVALDQPTEVDTAGASDDPGSSGGSDDAADGPSADANGSELSPTADSNVPVETFPPAEPGARNILITGADNNACLDPDSRFASAFGDREGAGERSDTIMMWRVNPATDQVAVLSFPRDLWLKIDGRSSKGRINSAYERDDPQRLINTIRQNFGIETDHFVQVDFCAFKELVDAVGGVAVPFETPVRDGATGLIVEEAGCFTFSGEHALAYVRSRKIEYLTEDGRWERDGTSDLGRISRQQDFIRRVGDELLSNVFSPSVVRTLFDVSKDYIVTDTELTLDRIQQFAGVLQASDPADITTYQIEARGTTIQGNSVLEPRLGGGNMQAVLKLFRGEVTLANRPDQVIDPSTGESGDVTAPETTVPVVDPDSPTTTTIFDSAPTTELVPLDTIPAVETVDIVYGVVPNSDISCT
jgi:LCP family protein required for cell wall assembly